MPPAVRNAPVTLAHSDIESMFEPLWRKDPKRERGEHSGLGLAIVRAMAESMNASATASLDAPPPPRSPWP
jgi:signal transduction histidine kinase